MRISNFHIILADEKRLWPVLRNLNKSLGNGKLWRAFGPHSGMVQIKLLIELSIKIMSHHQISTPPSSQGFVSQGNPNFPTKERLPAVAGQQQKKKFSAGTWWRGLYASACQPQAKAYFLAVILTLLWLKLFFFLVLLLNPLFCLPWKYVTRSNMLLLDIVILPVIQNSSCLGNCIGFLCVYVAIQLQKTWNFLCSCDK